MKARGATPVGALPLFLPGASATGRKRGQNHYSFVSWQSCLLLWLGLLAVGVVTVQFHFVSLDRFDVGGLMVIHGPAAKVPSPPQPLPLPPPPPLPRSNVETALAVTPETNHAQALPAAVGKDEPRRLRICYAITITRDGFFQDGAAVLAYSIIKNTDATRYDISLIAFVHPSVVTSRPVLSRIGFHVIEAPTPVNVTAIKFKFLREKINKNGCCGASELIKINSYRLEQYDKVVHLDADTCLLQPIDELLLRNVSLIYTTDPNMATHNGEDRMPSQGGLLVLQPSLRDYRAIINIVLTTEFNMGGGWNGSKIGWFWGGMTVQGVLPYYYNAGTLTPRGRRQIVDRCIYNTMADSDECQKTSISEIKSAHFTICQKPWTCYASFVNPLCAQLHAAWFALRKQAEQYYSLPVAPDACRVQGRRKYAYMQLNAARLPDDTILVRDDSADFLKPTAESRFLSEDWERTSGGKNFVPDSPEEVEEKRVRKEKREAWEKAHPKGPGKG